MTHYEQEILDIHVALENWLGAGEGDRDALLARFRPDFLMIPPSGNPLDHHALAQFLNAQRGTRPGLRIGIDALTTLQTWDNGAVLHTGRRKPGLASPSTCAGQPRCLIRKGITSPGVCCTKRRNRKA